MRAPGPSSTPERVPSVDTEDPALPVTGTGRLSHVRKSSSSRWRALVLIALHVVIAAHATHFWIAGRTLSPVEPSEAMYTFELGQINAGFLEMSNVNVIEEMIAMITAQRAYELNSKSIQTADEMLEGVNQLKR